MQKSTIYLFLCSLLLVSCKDLTDAELPDYQAEFAIPIIEEAIVTVPAIWQSNDPNQSLSIAPDGQLIFQYESPVTRVEASQLLGNTLAFLLRETVPENSNKVPLLPDNLPVEIRVEEALLKGGLFSINFTANSFSGDSVDIVFTIPEITKDGEPLQLKTDDIRNNNLSQDVSGYLIKPTNNQLSIEYTAVNKTGIPQKLNNITMLFSPQVQVLKGFLEAQAYVIPKDIIPIDLFDGRFLNGSIQFAEPKISARAQNAFGLPVRSQVDLLNAIRPDGTSVPINATAINYQDINYPSIEELGTYKETELFLDHRNSNLPEIFNEEVAAVEYGLTALINPTNDTTITSFLTDTSFFTIQVFVEIPVIGSVKDFSTEATYAVSLSKELETINNFEEGTFKLIVDNELPLDAQLQLYFLNEGGVIIDSLFQEVQKLVEGAPTDDNGQAISSTEQITFIPINASQIEHLQETEALQIKALFNTTGSLKQPVRILDSQAISVRLGLRVTL